MNDRGQPTDTVTITVAITWSGARGQAEAQRALDTAVTAVAAMDLSAALLVERPPAVTSRR